MHWHMEDALGCERLDETQMTVLVVVVTSTEMHHLPELMSIVKLCLSNPSLQVLIVSERTSQVSRRLCSKTFPFACSQMQIKPILRK